MVNKRIIEVVRCEVLIALIIKIMVSCHMTMQSSMSLVSTFRLHNGISIFLEMLLSVEKQDQHDSTGKPSDQPG
jgi:hypothetical protein